MDHMIITWLLLDLMFCMSTQAGNDQANGVLHCEPQNVTLNTSDQILLTWKDDPSCPAARNGLIYELVVFIADEEVHHEDFAVMPHQIGLTHSWNWKSHLAMECASHLVRLRSRYNNHTSLWKEVQTLPGTDNSKTQEVYPRDRMFEVGSRATFCCILPVGAIFNKMYMVGYNDSHMKTTKISNQTYILTVRLNRPAKRCTDVICETNTTQRTQVNGACAYIGYPPDDRGLQCETRDLQSVECHWTEGRDTHLFKSPTVYQLLGSHCADGSMRRCKVEVQVDAGERNWTLTAKNDLGRVEVTDRADLTKRVHMITPKRLMALNVNARNVTLQWEWTVQQYSNLNITCQVKVSHGDTNTISESTGVGLQYAVLTDLIPHWTYNVTVRCGTAQHFWKWSDWSTSVNFLTKSDVPDALDVWRQVKGNQVIILWKVPLANQSHGHIEDYEVTWAKTTEREQQNTALVLNCSFSLSLNTTEEYIVTVTARNMNGKSSPSTITIPSRKPETSEGTERVSTSWITGSNGTFHLSWSASPAASCGYIVDWCPTLRQDEVEWLKVPPNETTAKIFSKNFTDGVRYSVSVYACTQAAPVLLERREGYVSEKRIEDSLFDPLQGKQQNSDVVISWAPINLTEQSAFIRGYVLYCLDVSNNNVVLNVSTDKPEDTSLTARNLNFSSYLFQVKAQTAVGECGTTPITFTLNSLTDNLVKSVVIILVTVFILLTLMTILCYRHWTCIKQKVYPPIPKPVLNEWVTSKDQKHYPLHVDQDDRSEADVVAVSEAGCDSVAPDNGYVSPENMNCSQTPNHYYNHPLGKCTSPLFPLSSTAIPSQSRLSSSPFRNVFHNLSYVPVMKTEDQWSISGPDFQETTHLERSSSGYQPQNSFSPSETMEDPGSPMSCVSTYILLPQSHSK
uniref:leukemia inhibitory factor receptor-like isoform X2 n=1 Tax=Scatophagus argus TaxID=75038 RepID=UPI001ED7E118|nr:leukemia inhibitory factor receptor-like isoform X2 [Scatophagus argus]